MKEKEKFEEIELQEIQCEEKEALVPIKETDGKSYAISMWVTGVVDEVY